MAAVQEPDTAKSDVDMGTDPHNPPTEFTHVDWVGVRDALWNFGSQFGRADHRNKLYR